MPAACLQHACSLPAACLQPACVQHACLWHACLQHTCSYHTHSMFPVLRQVIELEPAYTDASLALVSVLHAQGKTRDALALLEQLKASQPEMAGWCEQQAVAMRAALAAG